MKNVIYLIALTFLIAGCKIGCKTKSEYKMEEKGFKSELNITFRQPYCGGAKPSPEMEKGTIHPFVSQSFIINNASSNKTLMSKTITTDATGNASINLAPGAYEIYLSNKAVSYEEFKKAELKKIEGKQLKLISDKCLREYWEKPDGKITVTGTAQYKIEIRRTCYADFNYCMQYTGPLPP